MRKRNTKSNTFVLAGAVWLAMAVNNSQGQPVFITQPQSQSVSLGVDVILYAQAYGSSAVSYQWRKDGLNLPGQTMELLILSPAQPRDTGDYVAVASNQSGSATSQVARVTVDPSFTKITAGPIVNDVGSAMAGCWGDYDQDGYLDLYIAHSGVTNTLYHNNRDGTFSQITTGAVVTIGNSHSAAWGDVNNDGLLDLIVANDSAQNEWLFVNNGGGSFTRATNGPLVNSQGNSYGAVWSDFDNDGWLDIFVLNFADLSGRGSPGTNYLYRNNRDGSFSSLPIATVPGNEIGGLMESLVTSAACADYNGDGRPDLLITRGIVGQVNSLHRNEANFQFTRLNDSPLASESSFWSDAAWGDYDNDGFIDVFLANGFNSSLGRTNALFHNNGNGTFTRIISGAIASFVNRAYGAACADYDNDGWLDLFVTELGQTNTLWHNNGDGTFTQITSGSLVNDPGISVGCAWGDYDNNGFPDLFVANFDCGNFLYRNNGNSNGWLKVQCVGRRSNRIGLGAKVQVSATLAGTNRWQLREINGGSTVGSESLLANFGLGDATNADIVRVQWPSGIVQELYRVASRQMLTLHEPDYVISPLNAGAAIGGDFTFAVSGGSTNQLLYQWRFNGVDIPDETNATLRLTNVQSNQFGSYTMVVKEPAGGCAVPSPVTLRAAIKPAIMTQPQPASQSVSLGAVITFNPVVTGTGPLLLQWRQDDADVAGATNATLLLTNVQVAQAGRYVLVASNPGGAVTSQVVSVQVDPAFTKVIAGEVVTDGGSSYGVAALDVGGGPFSGLLVINAAGRNNFLYRNDGAGRFSRVPSSLAGPLVTDVGDSVGVAVGDYDNDGVADVFVANFNNRSNFLYHGEGNGAFRKITTGTLVTERGYYWSGAWGDVNRDGFLDLFVSAYGTNCLYINCQDGTFERVTDSPVTAESLNSRACAWVDYDKDGDLDLFVSNVANTNSLFQNDGRGAFAKVSSVQLANGAGGGNGCAWGDYDNDGDLDLFVAKNGPDLFYENNGDGTFTRVTTGTVVTDGGNSTACAWVDYDNDGWLDLYVANAGTKFLYHNNGDKTFTRVTTGSPVNETTDTRGCVWADFDGNGFADLFLANYNQNNALYLNNGNSNHWLQVQCEGRVSNRLGIGAKVRMRAAVAGGTNLWQMREISSGDGLGSQALMAQFGLGQATQAQVIRIEWPLGAVQELTKVQADQRLRILEPTPLTLRQPLVSGSQFEFTLTSSNEALVLIETSTNLRDWAPWLTLTNREGLLRLDYPETTTPQRYYRAVSQ